VKRARTWISWMLSAPACCYWTLTCRLLKHLLRLPPCLHLLFSMAARRIRRLTAFMAAGRVGFDGSGTSLCCLCCTPPPTASLLTYLLMPAFSHSGVLLFDSVCNNISRHRSPLCLSGYRSWLHLYCVAAFLWVRDRYADSACVYHHASTTAANHYLFILLHYIVLIDMNHRSTVATTCGGTRRRRRLRTLTRLCLWFGTGLTAGRFTIAYLCVSGLVNGTVFGAF